MEQLFNFKVDFGHRQSSRVGLFALLAVIAGAPSLAVTNGDLGNVNFETTCASEANVSFNKGLSLLHHMMYFQADSVFSKAAEQYPQCAMLHWGIAMSKFHPLWPGRPAPEVIAKGKVAIERMSSARAGSNMEQSFVAAVTAFYEGADVPYPKRIANWAVAQADVFANFPEDEDAVAFQALALLASAPRGDKTLTNQRKAGALMETLNKEVELHPGVYHYAIHAYDNPVLFEKGLSFAEDYGTIAPDVAHALHMPSHIFVRAGYWDQVIEWNTRSAAAALAQPLGDTVSSHYAHAMDYRIYAHLQHGDFETAETLVAEFLGHKNQQSNFGSAYGLAASSVRVLLEKGQWAELATLDDTMHSSIAWEKFPQTVSIRWFAIGLGAARSGDLDRAGDALSKLAEIRSGLDASNIGYWLKLTDAQILSVRAWSEHARGNEAEAISLQTEAANIEDAAGKSPVTPGHVLPARELLGDLLTELGNAEAAMVAYQEALKQAPNRYRSVSAMQ